MGNYRIDPKKQFSKRLARWTAVFWFAYMIYLSTIMLMQPQAAQYSFYMGLLATVTMMVNVVSYTTNSIQEKILFAMIDKAKIEMNFSNTNKHDQTETESDADESEVSNG